MCLNNANEWQLPSRVYSDLPFDISGASGFTEKLRLAEELDFLDEEDVIEYIGDLTSRPGCMLISAGLHRRDGGYSFSDTGASKEQGFALGVCESLGLVRKVEDRMTISTFSDALCAVTYAHITEIGQELINLSNPDLPKQLKKLEEMNKSIWPANVSSRKYNGNWRIAYKSEYSNKVLTVLED